MRDAFLTLELLVGGFYLIMWPVMICDLLYFLVNRRRIGPLISAGIEYAMIVAGNAICLLDDAPNVNSCCGDTAFFSPQHRLTPYVIIVAWSLAYVYCMRRKKLAAPLIEVLVNCLLLIGIVMDIVIGLQVGDWVFWVLILAPQFIFIVRMLIRNHRWVKEDLEQRGFMSREPLQANRLIQFCWFLLRQILAIKIPVLLVLCIPLLVCVVAILQIFGQQPDSIVHAFTDTYKHGLSRLDAECNGVVCGGHFLCTIAAKGHPGLVRPLRAGIRAGAPIKCNRQLLVANAFEEWLEQHWPSLHRPIRRLYNHVGSYLHRHYGVFDKKWISDLVYLLMKPLEWIFLLFLYLVDPRPESRIAQQYLSLEDRRNLKSQLLNR